MALFLLSLGSCSTTGLSHIVTALVFDLCVLPLVFVICLSFFCLSWFFRLAGILGSFCNLSCETVSMNRMGVKAEYGEGIRIGYLNEFNGVSIKGSEGACVLTALLFIIHISAGVPCIRICLCLDLSSYLLIIASFIVSHFIYVFYFIFSLLPFYILFSSICLAWVGYMRGRSELCLILYLIILFLSLSLFVYFYFFLRS